MQYFNRYYICLDTHDLPPLDFAKNNILNAYKPKGFNESSSILDIN
jgi:hypothetical protein